MLTQYFTSEVIRVPAKISTASYSTYCLAGRLLLRCCEGEGGGGWGEEGGFCCDPVYYFGWGFLLAVWSWGRSAQPAGTEDTGWPQPDTEATWPEREKLREVYGKSQAGL
ncbi:Ecotin [Dissostichus eleginoides]|uniref:Ecotin n=1 Tax=Dissostichus eleginoides TaxID=100907 RepID=A0AAD9F5F8_DISEL|nr:Ecotin [Dissostichus eleginoides]